MAGQAGGTGPGTFEDLYDAWSDAVYRYLAHLIGSPEVTEDLFQETWMKALEHRHELENPGRFGPWVLRIARNLAFNYSRQSRRRGQVWILSNLVPSDGEETPNLLERESSAGPGPRDLAITAERRRILRDAVVGLDLTTQEMIQLRYFEHLTLAEVAEVLGVPLGTVCTKIHRALKTIRERMKAKGFGDLNEI